MTTFAELPQDLLDSLLKRPYDHKNILENVNLSDSIDKPINREGWTLLHYLVYFKEFDAAVIVLKAGANPNIRDHMGETPLFLINHPYAGRMARLLIQHNAQIDIVCQGKTYLDKRLSFDNTVSGMGDRFEVNIDDVERFKFTDKLKRLGVTHYSQGIADINSTFSVIAEAIYLEIIANQRDNFDITTDVKKLKEYSNDYRKNKLSNLFWSNLFEYGKRVHEGYLEAVELEKKGPSEMDEALTSILLQKELSSAIYDAANLVLMEPTTDVTPTQTQEQRDVQTKQKAAQALSLAADIVGKDARFLDAASPLDHSTGGAILFQHLAAKTAELATSLRMQATSLKGSVEETKEVVAETVALVPSKTAKTTNLDTAKESKKDDPAAIESDAANFVSAKESKRDGGAAATMQKATRVASTAIDAAAKNGAKKSVSFKDVP